MAPPCSSIQFIDTALSCTSPFALSYTDLNQKWLIRKHLISLVQDHPDFTLSTDSYYHNDGSTVNLLNATGYLRVSNITPPVHVTIWLHENYPHMPPIVFINTSSNTLNQIHQNHPFVDLCGLTTSPYLQTWLHPGCNLCNLVHNLIKIFSHDHPFSYSSSVRNTTSFTHPSLVSKREALDRLSGMLHYDKAALQAKAEEDIEGLSILQVELEKRAGVFTNIITELEHESLKLKERVMELAEETDVVVNWLKVNDAKSFGIIVGEEMENAFEGVDEESKMVINGLAADRGIEDVIYELDKALEQGVVSFDIYIKQVRNLARDQFPYRDLLVKLKGPDILI
ncbi:hypothetical protein EZV62_010733 [Acer yangbiense]|uniref:UEV domain-containing protein n=1 Tax=Acer yangbiense TaxID=1000413 RepID=A0A5C7I469_9ROSI|nr:hypothetical protein EZV62_010733 [Acer yangbiense]